jgi:hypothetical protein
MTVTESVTTFSQWIDAPVAVALLFGLAGAFFVGIYLIRRARERRMGTKV